MDGYGGDLGSEVKSCAYLPTYSQVHVLVIQGIQGFIVDRACSGFTIHQITKPQIMTDENKVTTGLTSTLSFPQPNFSHLHLSIIAGSTSFPYSPTSVSGDSSFFFILLTLSANPNCNYAVLTVIFTVFIFTVILYVLHFFNLCSCNCGW